MLVFTRGQAVCRDGLIFDCYSRGGWEFGSVLRAVTDFGVCFCIPQRHAEQPTQNWCGQGESDCLIKTKHCDGRKAMLTQCDFCPVL